MLLLLESKKEVAAAQRALKATMRREFRKTEIRNLTFQGGLIRNATVFTNGTYWYHSDNRIGKDSVSSRFLNEFGVLTPGNLPITVEINVPHESRTGRVAGFFARDSATSATCLMHSGKVGGSQPGVGAYAFRAWLEERPCEVFDSSGRAHLGFIVMSIDGLHATTALLRYVDRIAKFKKDVRNGAIDPTDLEFQRKVQVLKDFYSEPRGRRSGRRSGKIDFVSRHGQIVDALHDWRRCRAMPARPRIKKNIFIDMAVVNTRGQLTEIYEIKTSAARSDIYSAIGQIMVHGPCSAKKVLVLPEDEPVVDDLRDALRPSQHPYTALQTRSQTRRSSQMSVSSRL